MAGPEEEEKLIEEFFGIEPRSSSQSEVMTIFARMFSEYYHDSESVVSLEDHLKKLRSALSPDMIFTHDMLGNNLIFAKIHEQLVGMGLSHVPYIRTNARYPMKVAHLIYPGGSLSADRDFACRLIKAFFDRAPAELGPSASRASSSSTEAPTVAAAHVAASPSNGNMELQTTMLKMMQLMMQNMNMGLPAAGHSTPVQNEASPTTSFESRRGDARAGDRHHRSDPRAANNRACQDIGNRFKAKDSKFSGDDTENLQEYLDQYLAVSEDFGLTATQRLQYMHNLFRGEALRFFIQNIRGTASTIGEAVFIMQSQFNSADKQQRVKAELSTVKLRTFVNQCNGSLHQGLRKLAAHIEERTPLCPPNFRFESNRVDFLRQAVISYPWAQPMLYKISPSTKFRSLFTELANALQVHEESSMKNDLAASETSSPLFKGSKPNILFTQPKYAKTLFPGAKQDSQCWNCGNFGHRFTQCRKPMDMTAIAARKAAFYDKKKKDASGAKRTLFELAQGFNELLDLAQSADDIVASAYFHDASDSSSSDDEPPMANVKFLTGPGASDENVNSESNAELDF